MNFAELIELLEPHKEDPREIKLWIDTDSGFMCNTMTSIVTDSDHEEVYIQSLPRERRALEEA